MKKKLSKIMAVMLIMVMVISGTCINTAASGYPIVVFFSDADYEKPVGEITAKSGDIVYIRMGWLPEYNDEGYDMAVYNSSNQVVATASNTWTNYDSYQKHISIKWDTKGYSSGKYTVEVTKKFYSLFRWNEAPTKDTLIINLKDKLSKKSSSASKKPAKVTGLTAKNSSKKAIVVKYNKSKNAKKYKIQYSTDKKFKKKVQAKTTTKTTYTIKNLKKKSTYYVRVRAVNGNKKSSWTTAKKVKIKK